MAWKKSRLSAEELLSALHDIYDEPGRRSIRGEICLFHRGVPRKIIKQARQEHGGPRLQSLNGENGDAPSAA
jgi:hypothetical protein